MRILSVDYGDVRTGVAVSDESGLLSTPVCVINEKNTERLLKKITEKAQEYSAELIVVGYPKNMNGSIGERAQKCSDFANALNRFSGIQTTLWDERCTTMSAYVYMNYTDTRGSRRRQSVDAAAASIILQDYLDYRRSRNENT